MDRERAPDDLLDDVWLAELSRLLPELRERYPDLPAPAGDEASSKARLFEAVATFVTTLAALRPVVLFLDDVHWTDAASFDLLHYAARAWVEKGAPVLLAVAGRLDTPAVRARLAARRSSFAKDLPFRRELLLPLTRRDTIRLVRERVAPGGEENQEQATRLDRFGEWLHDETGGQPFFLTEALSDLIERGVVVPGGPSGGGWLVGPEAASVGTTPPGVREAILARLERLSPDAAMLLAAAAVVGRHCDFEILRRVVGTDEDSGLVALDGALASGLLSEVSGDAYACAHDKIRDVVYTEAGGARRRIYHRRALEVLENERAPAAELARHALAAQVVGAAFHHSVAAAEEALALFAVEDARAHFGRARMLLEGDGSAGEAGRLGALEERLGLYRGIGSIHEVSREWDEAQDAYERMLSEARQAGDREAEWATLNRLAALGLDEGDVSRAEQGGELHREVRRRRDGAHGGADRTEGFSWSLSTARARETEALGLAREMRRPDLTAQSLAALGVLEALLGRWDRALAAADEGIAISSRTGDHAMKAELLSLAARSLTMTGEARAAVGRMRDHPGLTGALGDRAVHRADVFTMALALTETGQYDEALAVARAGLAAARSVDYAPRLMLNLLALGDTLQALFQLAEADEIYQEMADVVFPPEYGALVHAKLSAVAALAGRWDEAYAEALAAAQRREEAPIQSTEVLHRHLEVEALLRGGNRTVVSEQLGRFAEVVGDNRRLRLAYGRSSAVLHRFDGDGAAVRQQLHEAWELADELDLPAERWQIEASLAEAAAGRGADAEARRYLTRAADGVRGLAEGIRDPELRQGFLSAAPARRVLGAALAALDRVEN
jgi:tetratricopeptide (TPR) repeat protein